MSTLSPLLTYCSVGSSTITGRTYKFAVELEPVPASLTTTHMYHPPSCVALIYDRLNVSPVAIGDNTLNTALTFTGRWLVSV